MTGGWRAVLEGVVVSGSIETPGDGILTAPPDGLGAPALTTHDVAYVQRDGVGHFDDWYGPRIITLTAAVGGDQCSRAEARRQARAIIDAWARRCDDTELVIFTDADGEDVDLSLVGPYSAIGRPRVATIAWQPANAAIGLLTLRFDAVDHRLYVLGRDGTPGSGGTVVEVFARELTRTYNRTYSWAYGTETGGVPVSSAIGGTVPVFPSVVFYGPLTSSVNTLTETTSGTTLALNMVVPQGDYVTVDTEAATAYTSNGTNVSQFLAGSGPFQLEPGPVTFTLQGDGEGRAEVAWRPVVLSA